MQASHKKPPTDHGSVRFGQRVPFDAHVRLRAGDRVEGSGVIRNASVSGAFIATALELPLYTELTVTLSLRGEEPASRVLEARVVRIEVNGLGVEWRDSAGSDVLEIIERAS
jgi:hypothetical protein